MKKGCGNLPQHCSRISVEVYALVRRAERNRIAELDIVTEQTELNGSSAGGVHNTVVYAVVGSDGNGGAYGYT